MYSRILAPVDGSAASDHGMSEAIKLAKELKAHLRVLNVVDESAIGADAFELVYWDTFAQGLREESEKIIARAKSAAAAEGVAVEGAMVESTHRRVAQKILDDAGAWGADLIVMGTHGRRGIAHLVLGSDAQAVLHGAKVPVLLVKAGPGGITSEVK